MPILASESSIFPRDLLEPGNSASEADNWSVLVCRARSEKAVARCLHQHQVPFFLPLCHATRNVRGRRTRSFLPLFPGYVFIRATRVQLANAVCQRGVAQVLPVSDGPRITDDLCQLWRLLQADQSMIIERCLAPGRRVRVRYGPLAGMEGTVLSRRGNDRLVVAVRFLQQGVSVSIDLDHIEPVV